MARLRAYQIEPTTAQVSQVLISGPGQETQWASISGLGGGASHERLQTSFGTGSLPPETTREGEIMLARSFRLIRIWVTGPCRVRFYTNRVKRALDAPRLIGVDPENDHGLIAEFLFGTMVLSLDASPTVDGSSFPEPEGEPSRPANVIPWSVTNLGPEPTDVTVALLYLVTEA